MRRAIFLIIPVLLLGLCMNAVPASSVENDELVLTLDECMVYALSGSFEVQLAKLDLLIAETELMYVQAVFDTLAFANLGYSEDKRQQNSIFASDDNQTNIYSVGLQKTLPTGTELKASWSDTRDWSNSPFVSENSAHNAELSLEARQSVGKNSFGYVDRNRVTITRLALENADLETRDRIEAHMARAATVYADLLYAKRAQEILEDILKKAKDLYEADKRNYDIGLIERVDLFASEANVANRQAELIVAEDAYKRAQENLKLILNINADVRVVPEEKLAYIPLEMSLEDCLKEAFEKRRDYNMSKRDVEIKGIDLKMKGNLMWPEIDLVGTMAMNGLDTDFRKAAGRTTVADNTYYYAGIEFSIPLENREARSEYDRVEKEKEKALVKMKDVERTIITDVVNTYDSSIAYGRSIIYTKNAMELQAEKLAAEEKRFHQGRSSTKKMVDYQQDLLRAQLEDARFVTDHRKSKIDLYRAMNVILDEYKDRI